MLIFFFFFFLSSSSSMYEMDPLSGRILRTNLSDVKNSCKHTTYKSNINLKWNRRSKKNSKITQWQTPWLVVPHRPSIYLILYSEHMISLTNWVDLHNFIWYSYLFKKIDMTGKYDQLLKKKKKRGQNNTIKWTLQILSFLFLPNGLIISFHSFNIKLTNSVM